MPDAGHTADPARMRYRHPGRHDDRKLKGLRGFGAVLLAGAAITETGCAWHDHAMSYLQCSAYVTRAEKEESMWLNARAVFDCRFDLDGRLRHE